MQNKIKQIEKLSPEQKLFAEKVIQIVVPTFEQFEFKKHRIEIKKYSSVIVYKKDNQYLKISSSTYPRDYPYSYNINLGEGDSEEVFGYDWNSVALWRLKRAINPQEKGAEYEFPTKKEVEPSLEDAKAELLKYAITF